MVALVLFVPGLLSCQSSAPLRKTGRLGQHNLMDHPLLKSAAEELLAAAQSAISAGKAPDDRERRMVSPLVTGNGSWEASVVSAHLAALAGRLQPVQPRPPLSSVPSIQAWLRESGSPAVVWVVTSAGRYRQQLGLTLCSGTRSWSATPVKLSIPQDEREVWPFDPRQNPPLARVEVGSAEAFFFWENGIYLEDRTGARELRWKRSKRELSVGKRRPWKDFGRSWVTRHLGMPHDFTPALALLRKDLRLILSNADLPRGEGEIVRWSLSRGGSGMELPLVRASAEQLLGIEASPPGWDERGTWLVLRQTPGAPATVELFSASLRELRRPVPREKESPPETIRVVTELNRPFQLPPLDEEMSVTHEIETLRLPLNGEWARIARWRPLYPWLSPLELWNRGEESLDAIRDGEVDPSMHVVRMCALDEAFPRWVDAAAKGPLALGDRAYWRRLPAASLYGVARIDPSLPAALRHALAARLARLGPFELFGLRRDELSPRWPLSGRVREKVSGGLPVDPIPADTGMLRLTFHGCPGILDPPPGQWRRELAQRLRFLLADAGWKIASAEQDRQERSKTGGREGSEGCVPVGKGWIDLARLALPVAPVGSEAFALLTGLGLREVWDAQAPQAAKEGMPAAAVEEWLLREGYLVPLWTEPGAVFVDRRLSGAYSDARMVLPDLREAVLLPREEFARFGLNP